jgi:hypothetical protein
MCTLLVMVNTPKHVGGVKQIDINYRICRFCWFLFINSYGSRRPRGSRWDGHFPSDNSDFYRICRQSVERWEAVSICISAPFRRCGKVSISENSFKWSTCGKFLGAFEKAYLSLIWQTPPSSARNVHWKWPCILTLLLFLPFYYSSSTTYVSFIFPRWRSFFRNECTACNSPCPRRINTSIPWKRIRVALLENFEVICTAIS